MTEDVPPDYVDYVQQVYFSTGLYTHLHVSTSEEPDGISVRWMFTFQDLGCTHTISREVMMGMDESTGDITVDGIPFPDLQAVEAAIFEGHYAKYMRDLYEFEGITTP